MNTKIASFVLVLVLVAMACNALSLQPAQHQPSFTSSPTTVATETPTPPSLKPDLSKPRINGALLEFAYSSDPNDMNKMFGNFPYTHLPAPANILAVTFFLDLPVGWPKHKTELHIVWYRDGSPLKDSESSVVCLSGDSCTEIYTRRFSPNGFENGRYEARLYLGDELLEGPQAEVWLIDKEWVGDLLLMQCDSGTEDTCENAAGQLAKFSEQVTIPTGRSAVHVSNAYANLPPGTEWQVQLYRGELLIDSQSEATRSDGHLWSGWRTSQLSDQSGAPFEPGLYTVKLILKGNIAEIISFEVK